MFGEATKPFLQGVQAAEAILVVLLILFAIVYQRVNRRVVKRMEEKREGDIPRL